MSYGRRVITTDATEITRENVVEEVRKAMMDHAINRGEIDKLYDYYKGKTAVLGKKKEVRESINHKINENRAYEIVSFHKGYTFGEPIQYVRRENSTNGSEDDALAADVNALNGYMLDADKASCDNQLAEWLYVAGVGYRLVLPNRSWSSDGDEAPFRVLCLDPRQTFVVRHNDVEKSPIMAVYFVEKSSGQKVYSVYTKDSYYEVDENSVLVGKPHYLGMIPVVEYKADEPRLGVFEIVVTLLDALDELQSNRMDDIVQTVNSFLAILGGQLTEDVYSKLQEYLMLCLPEGVDAKYLAAPMSQNDIQTLKDDIYQSILTICGVPNRNGGTSTSDTGSAVIMRDGWQAAEARAKAMEIEFKSAEKNTLRLVLGILRYTAGTNLRLSDIDTHFTRRNYENIAAKSQVLIAMLNNPKIHPELAFAHCGMFPDAESAYLQSKEYYEAEMAKWQPVEVEESTEEEDDDVQSA